MAPPRRVWTLLLGLLLLCSLPIGLPAVRLSQLPKFTRPLNAQPDPNVQFLGSPPEGAELDTKVELLPPDMTDPRNHVSDQEVEEAARRILGEETYRELTRDDLSADPEEEDNPEEEPTAPAQAPLSANEHSQLELLLTRAHKLLAEGQPSSSLTSRDGKLPPRTTSSTSASSASQQSSFLQQTASRPSHSNKRTATAKMKQQDVQFAHKEMSAGGPSNILEELQRLDKLIDRRPVVAGVL